MMNIFIAVLCDAYAEASRCKYQIFWRTRVQIVLDESYKLWAKEDIRKQIYEKVRSCFRPGKDSIERVDSERSEPEAEKEPEMTFLTTDISTPTIASSKKEKSAGKDNWDYVWICV